MRSETPSSSPDSTVSFRGELTQQQFSRVQSLLLPWWARAYVVAPMWIFIFVSIGAGWSTVFVNPLAAISDLLLALIVLLASALITWFGRKKAWQSNARLHGQAHGQLTADGLEWNTATTTANFPWSKLLGFEEAGDLVLVLYAPRCAFYFPKNFFSDDLAWNSFKEMLASHLARNGAAS